MTITDKQYRQLSDDVYKFDSLHPKYDETLKKGAIKEYGGVEFEILKVKNNTENGMQAMAIAPLKENGEADTSNIVIAYAGTNSSDSKDIQTDFQTVVVGSDELTMDNNPVGSRMSDIQGNGSGFDPNKVVTTEAQSITAMKFAKAVRKDYPDATITTTGHSLGEYLAMFVAAENKWINVGFNGADAYNILSDEAKKWVEENPYMLTNYRNRGDFIRLNGNGTGAEIMISMAMGFRNPVDFHSMSHWTFDEEGKLIIPDNDYNQEAIRQQAERYAVLLFATALTELGILKKKLKASGGGLSSNEKIYLEDSQALSAISTASVAFQGVMSTVVSLYKKAITEAEQQWSECLRDARSSGPDLTDFEIIAALSTVGCTEYNIVTEPCNGYREKINKVKTMTDQFNDLAKSIRSKINELVQRDQELAKQLR